MRQIYLFAGCLVLGAAFTTSLAALQAQSRHTPPPTAQTDKKQTASTPGSQQQQNEGARIFEQNCSRCHTAPDGFSPRISGTIVRHMRIRASLSQHDEQELLRFFNP